jgi:hypothetical protein
MRTRSQGEESHTPPCGALEELRCLQTWEKGGRRGSNARNSMYPWLLMHRR